MNVVMLTNDYGYIGIEICFFFRLKKLITLCIVWCSHRELSPGVGEDRPSRLPPELLLLYFQAV